MRTVFAVAFIVLAAHTSAAQDLQLEVTEQALNRLVSRLGDPGAGGIYQPNVLSTLGYSGCRTVGTLDCTMGGDTPGQRPTRTSQVQLSFCQGPNGQGAIVPSVDPVSWQWWITQAHFTVAAQQLRFSANVRYRVGKKWFNEEKSVPATVSLDVASQRLVMNISNFTVPVRYSFNGVAETITEVDVGGRMSFAIPISVQTLRITDLEGRTKTITSRIQSAAAEYLTGKVAVKVYVAFN
jgi:hypothetical protein